MDNKRPVSVLIDGDMAMREAIQKVFPNAKHRLCNWHMHRNAKRNVRVDGFEGHFKHLKDLDANEDHMISVMKYEHMTEILPSCVMYRLTKQARKQFCMAKGTNVDEGKSSLPPFGVGDSKVVNTKGNTGGSYMAKPRKPRQCQCCRVVGHTRRTCPQNDHKTGQVGSNLFEE
ncbi:unnamed protein product [Camellia sinensis]